MKTLKSLFLILLLCIFSPMVFGGILDDIFKKFFPKPRPSTGPISIPIRGPRNNNINNCGHRSRIRKEVNTLTSYEKDKLRTALLMAINNPTRGKKFEDIANFHGAPYNICPDPGCCPHGDPKFLTWHRLLTVQFEELLDPYLRDTDLGLPYWDWTKNATIPDLWENIQVPIKDHNSGDFNSAWTQIHQHECQNSRNYKIHNLRIKSEYNNLEYERYSLKRSVENAMEIRNFGQFSDSISDPHGEVHVGLKCTMRPSQTAAYDPIFWLHHGFVDKLFSQWQSNKHRPYLDNNRVMVPFGSQNHNPFELTRRTEFDTWNHQLNLCYKYDFQVDPCPQCSTPVDPYEVTTDPFVVSTKFETHENNVTQEICEDTSGNCTNLTGEITTIIKEEIRRYKVKSYLAAIVPKHAGGVILNYKVCYGNESKKYYQEEIVQLDNGCLLGNMSLFGSTSDVNITSLPIDSEHFKVKKSLVSRLGRSVYDEVQWTSLDVNNDENLIPEKTPSLLIIEVTNGREDISFVHLPNGVKKSNYGNLLDSYNLTYNYCDTFSYRGNDWKLGHPSVCGWNLEDLSATLPIDSEVTESTI